MAKEMQRAVAYLRTSSAANVGADKDSDKRQRAAIEAFAKRAGAPALWRCCNGSRRTVQRLSSWSRRIGSPVT
jgi:DNA invertase Pin-like site-specific DNA recombinase